MCGRWWWWGKSNEVCDISDDDQERDNVGYCASDGVNEAHNKEASDVDENKHTLHGDTADDASKGADDYYVSDWQ